MIRQLLSKLPAPKPADWGYKVSVCIALCYSTKPKGDLLGPSGPRRDDTLILVTDNRAAFGDFSEEKGGFSGEYLTLKSEPLWHGWAVMYAGNEVEHANPIIRSAKKSMRAFAEKSGRIISPEEASQLVDGAYSEQLQAQIENRILRKRGYNTESFQQFGKDRCTPDVYARTWEQIGKEKLSLRFLVCGHDENGEGHIWLVDGDNAPTNYNSFHFWAIGTGASAALSRIALYKTKYEQFSSLEEALYVATTAKFAAEPNVGKSTFVSIHKHWIHENDAIMVGDNAIKAMRLLWEETEVPPVPKRMLAGLRVHLTQRAKLMEQLLRPFVRQKAKQEAAPRQLKSRKLKSGQ